MAERRPAGFNVALRFYDSDEVLSIPRRIRCEAVGAWTLCGSYSANQLSDGYVSFEKLKQLGVRPAVRDALMATTPEPLWIIAPSKDGIQFTRWGKWQRTAAEVKDYRAADAQRKRDARSAKSSKNVIQSLQESSNNLAKNREYSSQNSTENVSLEPRSNCGESEMSRRTSVGRPQNVRVESSDPKPKTKPKTDSGYLGSNTHPSNDAAIEPISATPGADLVRAVIPREHPDAVKTALRQRATELINTGTPPDTVEAALRLWLTKPNVGPNILPALVSEVIKSRHVNNGVGKPTEKALGYRQLGHELIEELHGDRP